MKFLRKRPLSPGKKHDMSIFFKFLKNGVFNMNFENFFYDSKELLIERFKKPVLSSPRFGVASLAKVLEAKGILTPQKNF